MKTKLFLCCLSALATSALLGCGGPEHAKNATVSYDILIRGGQVIDGTGSTAYQADVGILDGKIVAIGNLDNTSVKRTIDATGKVVTPGFIDLMGQSSLIFVADRPAADSRLRQGITTHVSGEGWSHAPQNDHTQPVAEIIDGKPYRWTTFSEYFEILNNAQLPLNVIHNVGAAQVRRMVIGEIDRAPSEEELEAMKALVRGAMDDGAIGLSTSLIYPPGNYATTGELIELAKVVAPYGGIYLTHMRNESHQLLEAIEESIEIGRRAGVPVHIYHLKAAGKDNWPLMALAIDRIQQARDEGMDVTADIYPYIRNGIGLRSFIAPQHYADGAEPFMATLDDPKVRESIKAEIEEKSNTWENWYRNVGEDWDKVLISRVANYPDRTVAGLSVSQAAKKAGLDEWQMFFELVKADVNVSPESMNEAQKHLALQTPWVMIETDSPAANPRNVDTTHPRAFGAFPRVIAKYVREDGVISLEDAISRMTFLPAKRVGIQDRGRIAVDMAADVLVFDPQKIQDTATFADPMQYAEGIDYLMVNGELVINQRLKTDALPGRVLRFDSPDSVH